LVIGRIHMTKVVVGFGIRHRDLQKCFVTFVAPKTWTIRGLREHNRYSNSLPFPLVNSHSHSRVLIFLSHSHLNSDTSSHSLQNHSRKTMKASKTVHCQISKIVICNASLTTQTTNTQVL